jgi:hypothetical protein
MLLVLIDSSRGGLYPQHPAAAVAAPVDQGAEHFAGSLDTAVGRYLVEVDAHRVVGGGKLEDLTGARDQGDG